jgi:transcriptional regulator with XRE-family HTH domain
VTNGKTSSIRETLAGNMRRLRLERQLSQEALADRAGIHRNYVGGVERGERNVGIDNVERIAGALGVTVPELLAG